MHRESAQKRPVNISEREMRHVESTMQRYERRLEDGFALIERRKRAGLDVTKLEAFWIDLLHQYEALCDGIPEAA